MYPSSTTWTSGCIHPGITELDEVFIEPLKAISWTSAFMGFLSLTTDPHRGFWMWKNPSTEMFPFKKSGSKGPLQSDGKFQACDFDNFFNSDKTWQNYPVWVLYCQQLSQYQWVLVLEKNHPSTLRKQQQSETVWWDPVKSWQVIGKSKIKMKPENQWDNHPLPRGKTSS